MKNKLPVWRIALNTLLIAAVVYIYFISARITGLDFPRLFRDAHKGRTLVAAFLTPDVFTRDIETATISTTFPIPCDSAPAAEPVETGPRLVTSVPCAAVTETFVLEGFDLAPNTEIEIRWRFPDGRPFSPDPRIQTDADGNFSVEMDAKAVAVSVDNVPSAIEVDTRIPVGPWKFSQAARDVFQAMFVTIFMALLSTSVATVVAAPLSFLAASNITKRGCIGSGVYYITRTFFNLLRSYEPLVMATVFAFWVGFGPFAGSLALTVVTIASLGKLFSEAVESIDHGPIEALQATGANRLQVVVYAVIPQIVPDFVSYIIYHWDINVRISTIIGFVGGGGIGYYLSQQINSLVSWHKAGTAIWAIVIVVWAMDFLSSEVRKRIS
jgi:phosphonate transport system permease protein